MRSQMEPETEQLLGTLELLADKLYFDLPGHEDGGYIYSYVWEKNTRGKFNIFNLCQENSWLKLTDRQNIIKSWRQLESARRFNDFSLSSEEIKAWGNNIDSLASIIQSLSNTEAYQINNIPYSIQYNIILEQVDNDAWVGIAPTVYVETNIPHKVIARHTKYPKNPIEDYGDLAIEFNYKIKAIAAQLGSIELNGDFGGGYIYSHTHQIIYAFGKTKELAFTNTLQKTGMLEISNFAGLYSDISYFDNYYPEYNTKNQYQKYIRINQFMEQNFSEVKVYRLASEISENIYILGEIDAGDLVGLYLKSFFVYNP